MATIDTNMSLVMIDPNEPLELYDGTIIKGRLEWFLYALCCLDYGNLPTPLSRIEEWANALITNELPNMEPQSRAEEFFKAILTGDTSNLPTPQSRSEVLLDKLARGENDFTNVEKIQSRYEFLLAYLIKNGGGIGNIDYVLYKFQKEDETLYNTKERPVKSAILKGQTLVNLFRIGRNRSNGGSICGYKDGMIQFVFGEDWDYSYTSGINCLGDCLPLREGKKYFYRLELNRTPAKYVTINSHNTDSHSAFKTYAQIDTINSQQTIFTGVFEADSNNRVGVRIRDVIGGETMTGTFLVVEYQEGMENWDIPYFEGMQSVKMPVLTTTGKNLFDTTIPFDTDYYGSEGRCSPCYYDNEKKLIITEGISGQKNSQFQLLKFKPNTTYTFSGNVVGHQQRFCIHNESKQTEFNGTGYFSLTVATGNSGRLYVSVLKVGTPNGVYGIENLQIEESSSATTYEPFKSNTLSTPEDLELRGIGNVKNELNVATGELTQRVGEVVFDGSEDEGWKDWWHLTNTVGCYISGGIPNNGKVVVNNIPYNTINGGDESNDIEGYNLGTNGTLLVRILKSKLSSPDLNGFKEYLASNPIVIQYGLTQESIKTVDLTITDQGGATIPKLKTFDKITHVNVSATDILPGVEMEVATTIGEDLSGTLYSTMEDIETKQEALKESNNAQTESVNSTMLATTEIYESLL